MFLHTLALAQSGPRFDGDTVNAAIIALVLAAVALVFWASRPSVIARHAAPPSPADETPAEEPGRTPPA